MGFRDRPELKTDAQICAMRRSGLVVAALHRALREAARPGITTGELDQVAGKVIEQHNARSNFLGYHGFPGNACISVNEEIVHGIPGSRVVLDGDVVSFDCGAVIDGWHADAAITVLVGRASEEDKGLVAGTEVAMWSGIAAMAKAKARLNDIGTAVEAAVEVHAERTGQHLGIVEEFVGHGIGSALHQPPDVVNFRVRERGMRLKAGLVLCIEPMLTAGSPEQETLADDWTVVTKDGSRAAHWEHTVALHEGGIWVLTAPDGGAAGLAPYGVSPVALAP